MTVFWCIVCLLGVNTLVVGKDRMRDAAGGRGDGVSEPDLRLSLRKEIA
jgi:hypothetical protein